MVKNVQDVLVHRDILLIVGVVGHILQLLNIREHVREVDVELVQKLVAIQEERQRVPQQQHVRLVIQLMEVKQVIVMVAGILLMQTVVDVRKNVVYVVMFWKLRMEVIVIHIIMQALVKKFVDIVVELLLHQHTFKQQQQHVLLLQHVRPVNQVMVRKQAIVMVTGILAMLVVADVRKNVVPVVMYGKQITQVIVIHIIMQALVKKFVDIVMELLLHQRTFKQRQQLVPLQRRVQIVNQVMVHH